MKTQCKENFIRCRPRLDGREEGGFVATVLFLGLLVVMLMLAAAGAMALTHLRDEVKVLQRQQIKRLDSSVTNSVAASQVSITGMNEK